MSRIERNEVERIVSLARLAMDEAELERMQRDLVAILDYV
jgi:Asp-tRNA(Asn)/Glu-tRNA(Gln) amidotransferase C subunit